LNERQRAGWAPYSIVAVGAVSSFGLILLGLTPVIAVPLAGAFFLLGALCRLVLPGARAGLLAARGRTADAVTLGLIGAMLVFGGLILAVPRHWIIP
jgi:hypothetical protein